MKIRKHKSGDSLLIEVSGELDSVTAIDFEKNILDAIESNSDIVFDMTGLTYISSAGLRVLLVTQKTLKNNGRHMYLNHVCSDVLDTLKVTGFTRLLTINT